MTLWEINNLATHRRNGNQWSRACKPKLRVDFFLTCKVKNQNNIKIKVGVLLILVHLNIQSQIQVRLENKLQRRTLSRLHSNGLLSTSVSSTLKIKMHGKRNPEKHKNMALNEEIGI